MRADITSLHFDLSGPWNKATKKAAADMGFDIHETSPTKFTVYIPYDKVFAFGVRVSEEISENIEAHFSSPIRVTETGERRITFDE